MSIKVLKNKKFIFILLFEWIVLFLIILILFYNFNFFSDIPRYIYRDNLTFSKDLKTIIHGNSMHPTINESDIIRYIFTEPNDSFYIGDIVIYNSSTALCRNPELINHSTLIAHRIIREEQDRWGKYFITKGDNNIIEDFCRVTKRDIKAIIYNSELLKSGAKK